MIHENKRNWQHNILALNLQFGFVFPYGSSKAMMLNLIILPYYKGTKYIQNLIYKQKNI
jgi:hypothetical protein